MASPEAGPETGPSEEDVRMDSENSMEEGLVDVCRVCRSEGGVDRPLFYPCLCTGSIKYVHQDCLMQWLKYSKKEYCELCTHQYRFQPIYHPDMPKRLPVRDLVGGVGQNVWKAVRCWLHYTVVAVAWLGVVPLTASRIYRSLFTGSVSSLLMLPLDMLSSDNIVWDCMQGGFIIALSLCAFIALVWLREQILHAGPPQVADLDQPQPEPNNVEVPNQENPPPPQEIPDPQVEGNEEGEAADEGNQGNRENEEEAEQNNAEPVEEPQAQPENGNAQQQQQPAQDEWRGFEWDRAADELTWERLLGLDGSLVFLEHVFWVISLNTLFILIFAFSPYHVGQFAALSLNLTEHFRASHFEGALTAMFGYVIICSIVFLIHQVAKFLRFRRAHKMTGMCYLVLKVFLLVLLEIGIFPLLCGWWLDICSLAMFSSSLKERTQSFMMAPGTSLFIHWLAGMVYVFYFASFVLLLREVLRPGVLWFLRNLNDPEFNPIQEMIQYAVYRHIRRYFASLILFAVTILLVIYFPVKTLARLFPSLLPYNISLNAETPLSELSLELLLLQVVLPALLEQSHARQAMKAVVQYWCLVVGKLLDLEQYLLPQDDVGRRNRREPGAPAPGGEEEAAAPQEEGVADAEPEPEGEVREPPNEDLPNQNDEEEEDNRGVGNLAEEHQALLLVREPLGFQPYRRPKFFTLRIVALLVLLALTSFCFSAIFFSIPVTLGRWFLGILGGQSTKKTHELYTIATGLYMCWLLLKFGYVIIEWIPRGWRTVADGFKGWSVIIIKCLLAAVALLGIIPYLVGLFFQLVIVAPVRVSLHQTPLFYPWQDWAMGIVHCKIICACLMMGPDWWIRRAFERLYQDGIRNLNVRFLYVDLVIPVCTSLGLAISIPYALSNTIVMCLGTTEEDAILLCRHIYPCLLLLVLVGSFVIWQFRQFSSLIKRIRNEKYLVGQRLVNYEPSSRKKEVFAIEAPPVEIPLQ